MRYEQDPEDGDEVDIEQVASTRRWLMNECRNRAGDGTDVGDLCGMLMAEELAASPYFLGLDYSDDYSDIDGDGPF